MMAKSQVYFTNFRTKPGKNVLDKLESLLLRAGFHTIDFRKKFTAIKIHFGEPGNLAFLRPNYAARIIKVVKNAGGIPFATDANTLYAGRRSNAVDHLEAASENGFNFLTLGSNPIIADGLKGTDEKEIRLGMKSTEKAWIASVIADADIIISLNHFKGHEMTGFGGCLKNLGMGSASRRGKLEIHCSSKPRIIGEKCSGCSICVKNCNYSAIAMNDAGKAEIDYEKCVGCGQCIANCMFGAATPVWDGSAQVANEKIAEYSYAVVKDKPNFHISLIMDVSPDCDCWSSNDVPLIPDVGMAVSFDPVALDRACVDIVNKTKALKEGALFAHGESYTEGQDKFSHIHPDTDWHVCLDYAEKIGLGSQDYEFIEIV